VFKTVPAIGFDLLLWALINAALGRWNSSFGQKNYVRYVFQAIFEAAV